MENSLTISEFLAFASTVPGALCMTAQNEELFFTYENAGYSYSIFVLDINLAGLEDFVQRCESGKILPDAVMES